VYQRTGDSLYYDTAVRVANYFLDNIPADGIVPWCVIFLESDHPINEFVSQGTLTRL